MIYRSQALGPFPPHTTPQSTIFPPFPPASTAQPRKTTPGPDTVVQASCKSNLSVDQPRLSIYDNSSFTSCMKLVQVISNCNCTENCPHTLQIICHLSFVICHLSPDTRITGVKTLAKLLRTHPRPSSCNLKSSVLFPVQPQIVRFISQ